MKIGPELVILWIVFQALGSQNWVFQPVGELDEPSLARGGKNRLVISHAEKNRKIAEGVQLMGDKVRPRRAEIGADGYRLVRKVQLRGRHHVFIEGVNSAKIA